MGSNSGYSISTIREVTPGTTPAGDLDIVLGSGLSPNESSSLVQSQDVRPDRGDADTPTGSWSSSSTITADHRHLPGYDSTGPVMGARLEMLEEACGSAAVAPYDSGAGSVDVDHTTNTLTRTGGWGTLEAGDDIAVRGSFTDFGALLIDTDFGVRMHVVSVTGNDMVVDEFQFSTTETVADAQVTRGYRLRLGVDIGTTTRTFQVFSPSDSRGYVYRRCGITGYRQRWQWDGASNEEFNIIHGEPGSNVAAALANTIRALPSEADPIGCREDAFAPLYPDAGLGYFLNGALKDQPEFQTMEFALTNTRTLSGGIGRQYTHGVDSDGLFGVTSAIAFKTLTSPGDTHQDEIWAASEGANASFEHAWGYRTKGGGIGFVRIPNNRVASRSPSGSTSNGTATRSINTVGKVPDGPETQLQITLWP